LIQPGGHYYNLGLRFYALSEQQGEKIALKYPDGHSVSYIRLNQISNKLARWLLTEGIEKGNVIAIFNEKSEFAYALMIACLKIGAIYTNLDFANPWLRTQKIISSCEPKIICFDKNDTLKKDIEGSFPSIGLSNLYDEEFRKEIKELSAGNLEESNDVLGDDPSYIMFTSGSTGFPKGAVMSHSNVLNFIQWAEQTFSVDKKDIFTNVNPIYFDNSVFDFYVSIYNGATLVPLSHELVRNTKELVQAINASDCSIWFSVPSLLVYLLTTKAIKKSDFSGIKKIVFGGEGFQKSKLKQLYGLFGERMTFYNVYGPTECTCICSSYVISEKDFEKMDELAPLGYIASNFEYEILPVDEKNRNFGELALAGPCVGLGYYNDVERRSTSFIQNPNKSYPQIMYRTGDLVEKAENGQLYFKGRLDNQVKHMGYRIELEEIEAALSTLDYVDEAAVIYQKINADLGQIKAFVSISGKVIDSGVILEEIKDLLPQYMIPRSVTILNLLPKNQNGKVDRKQLVQLS
jgi:D-alanine--poly(phosphoribitol) ligase subunit 1